MKKKITAGVATLMAVGLFGGALAQGVGLSRDDLLDKPIDVPGHKAVQVRVNFAPGAASIRHRHPGEEIAYALVGTIEYQLEGRAPVTLRTGQSIFIPTGVAHVAHNVGNGPASELATYVVRAGEPLVTPAN